MPVPRKPRAIAAPVPPVVPTLVRIAIALLATATLLFVLTPAVVPAQEPASRHAVEPGESLWSLAVRFYGDGHKWADLAKLNELGPNGEKGLVVGQVIKTPKSPTTPVKASAIAPPPNTPRLALARARQPMKPATVVPQKALANGDGKPVGAKPAEAPPAATAKPGAKPGALAAQTAGKADAPAKAPTGAAKSASSAKTAAVAARTEPRSDARAEARIAESRAADASPAQRVAGRPETRADSNADRVAAVSTNIWNIGLASQREARGSEQTTVFLGRTYDAVETDSAVKAQIRVEKPRVRTGEFGSAPFPIAAERVAHGGVIGHRAGSKSADTRDIDRLILADEVEVTLPSSVPVSVGTQFVSVETVPLDRSGTVVARPTGVLEIARTEPGHPVIARVVRQSGRIEEGQTLLPFEGAPMTNALSATMVPRGAGAPETHVTWVEGEALMPTLQSFVLLAAGEREGVKPGDQFALVERSGLGPDARERSLAVVRVVRVTSLGSTAIVIRQNDARIAVGGAARLVARAN